MKIIGTSGTKTLKVIPRQYVDGQITVKLTNETTKGVVTINPTASTDHNYMSFDAVFGTLKKDTFYVMDVCLHNTDTVIYKDKVFCTSQTINQSNNDYYSINKDQYVTDDSYNNDYILL
jgi:hypothetical protein